MSAAVSPGHDKIPTAYDLPELNKHFDFMNVMTYDYHGYWEDANFDHRFALHDETSTEFSCSPIVIFLDFSPGTILP